MIVIVHLNKLYDDTLLKARMEYAFGTDGKNFWANFFLCETRHPEIKFIYLFEGYQLKTIYEWLNKKSVNYGEETKKNLLFSRQSFFNESKTEGRSRYNDYRIRACYITYKGYIPDIECFCFYPSPPDKEEKHFKDFFDNEFIKEASAVPTGTTDLQKKVNELVQLKQPIANKILSPKDTKWLRYLGDKLLDKDHKTIEYCTEVDPSCPIVSLLPATPTITTPPAGATSTAGTDKAAG